MILERAVSPINPEGANYAGLPVMIRANDCVQNLYDGDVGLVRRGTKSGSDLRVWFETADGLCRILPARLPTHETVYGMTVHKSQGSEFNQVLLKLLDSESRVLTRELIYTGITSADEHVTLMARRERMA